MDVPYGLPLDFTSCITREYDGGGWYTQWTTVLEEWENWPTWIRNELHWSDIVTDPHMQTMDYGFVIGTVHSIANCLENTKNISSVLQALILSQYTERSLWKNVHITKRSENINSPIVP